MSNAHDIIFNQYNHNGICKNCGVKSFISPCMFVSPAIVIERERIAADKNIAREKLAAEENVTYEKLAADRKKLAAERNLEYWKGLLSFSFYFYMISCIAKCKFQFH